MATEVEKLIIAIESVGLKESQRELTKLKKAAKDAEGATEGLNKQNKKSIPLLKGYRGATSALTNTTGQLSVQIQDVAVQLESGTDAVRVFAQQGPQIAAIFGPSGAAFGAILAIGALIGGPFIRSLFDANEAITESQKKLKEYSGNLSDLSEVAKGAKLAQLRSELETVRETISSLEKTQQDAVDRFNDLRDGSVSFVDSLIEIAKGNKNLTAAQIESAEAVLKTRNALEEQLKKEQELTTAFDVLTGKRKEETEEVIEKRKNLETLVDAINEEFEGIGKTAIKLKVLEAARNGAGKTLQDFLEKQLKAIEQYEKEQQAAKEAQAREEALLKAKEALIAKTKEQADATRMSWVQMEIQKAVAMGMTAEELKLHTARLVAIQSAKDEKEAQKDLAEEQKGTVKVLQDIYNQKQKLIEQQKTFLDQFRQETEAERLLREAKELNLNQDQMRQVQLEVVRRGEAEYAKKQLEDAQENGRIKAEIQAQQDAEELRQRTTMNEALLGLENKLMKGKSEVQKAGFRIGVNLMNQEKRENATQILSDSYSAAMKAYKALAAIPIVGPALGAAAAGVIIAAGASYATKSLAGRAVGGQVRAGESYVVGERGPEVLTMGTGGRVIPNDKIGGQQQVVNKTANISFNINTVDARGFDSLLQSRRGQIINMVNTAMNDKGRRGVV